MKERTRSLNDKIQAQESKLIELEKRADKAQTALAHHEQTKEELYNYGIGFDDFSTVKNFLIEIKQLNGDPVRAVQIIEESGSLENKISQMQTELKTQ